MSDVMQTIVLVLGIVIWLSMYLFMEVKFEKIGGLKKKPIIRAIVLFVYMYLGITIIKSIL
ncbi:MAG: hypothetical protein WBA54_01050 [Acidaminobacteraceae bacterium]